MRPPLPRPPDDVTKTESRLAAAPEKKNKTTRGERIVESRKFSKQHVAFLLNAEDWLPRPMIARSLAAEAILLLQEVRA